MLYPRLKFLMVDTDSPLSDKYSFISSFSDRVSWKYDDAKLLIMNNDSLSFLSSTFSAVSSVSIISILYLLARYLIDSG